MASSPLPASDEDRQEIFRRATIATLRAVGGRPEQDVSFQDAVPGGNIATKPSTADTVQLPHISRGLYTRPLPNICVAADAAALLLRPHDGTKHPSPHEAAPSPTFAAIEQARTEVL